MYVCMYVCDHVFQVVRKDGLLLKMKAILKGI